MRRRPGSRQTHHGAAVLCTLAVAALALPGCPQPGESAGQGPGGRPVPEVRVAKVTVATLERTLELSGTVEPTRLARLASPAEGPVQRLLVREGDPVRRGQLLVVIGRQSASQAQVTADEEALRKASVELERVTRLVKRGAVPREQLDRARADHEQGRARVTAGMERSGDHLIRAPWSGLVARVPVREGNFVAPRTILLEIFDPDSLVVSVALPESVALRVAQDSPATVTFDALGEQRFVARVSRLFPELDRRLRTRAAELTVEQAPRLAPGMFVRVRLVVARAEGANVVPGPAIRVGADGTRAVLVVDEGKVYRRPVKTGIEAGEQVEIVQGVQAGEQVVVAGPLKLADGARVRVKAAPAPKQSIEPVRKTGKQGKTGRPGASR